MTAITTGEANITIGGGATDDGAWHRAVECGQWLFDKHMWDGRTHLTIYDPYKVHGKIFTAPFRWPKKGEDYVIDQLQDGVYVPVEIEGMEDPEAGVPIPPRDEIDPETGEVTPAVFDYSALDMETRIVVQQKTEQIKLIGRRLGEGIVTIGEHLITVKDKLGYGRFGAWLNAEFGWEQKTAERFMNVATRFQNRHNVEFSPTVLYLLAQPSTPDGAIEDLQERQESGEPVTVKGTKAVIDATKLDGEEKTKAQADAATIQAAFAGQTASRRDISKHFSDWEQGRLYKAINMAYLLKYAVMLPGDKLRFKAQDNPTPAPSPASGEGKAIVTDAGEAKLPPVTVEIAREMIIDALRAWGGGRGAGRQELFKHTNILDQAVYDAAFDAMLEAGSIQEYTEPNVGRRYHFPETVKVLTRDRDAIDDEPSAHESGWMVPIDEEVLEPPTTTDPVLAIPGMDGLMGTLDELRAEHAAWVARGQGDDQREGVDVQSEGNADAKVEPVEGFMRPCTRCSGAGSYSNARDYIVTCEVCGGTGIHTDQNEEAVTQEETALERLIRALLLVNSITAEDNDQIIGALRGMTKADRDQLRKDIYSARGVLGTLTASTYAAFGTK